MREIYSLTKKELKYLTRHFNNDLMGIGYSLSLDPQEELRIQESLLAKEYATSDFDSAFCLESDLEQLLSDCCSWRRMLQVTSTQLDREESFQRFFIDMKNNVVFESKKGDVVDLSYVETRSLMEAIPNYFDIDHLESASKESYTVGARRIEILSQLRRERLIKELQNDNCPHALAEKVADALSGKGQYVSIMVIEKTPKDMYISQKLTICYLNEACLIIHPKSVNDKQYLCFETGIKKQIEDEIDVIRGAILR